MIGRIWHGWTTPKNADAYEALLQEEVFVGIANRGIDGYEGIELLRREVGDAVEFVTIMYFASLDAVRAFAGTEYEAAVVPPNARALLARHDDRSQHYEIKARRIHPRRGRFSSRGGVAMRTMSLPAIVVTIAAMSGLFLAAPAPARATEVTAPPSRTVIPESVREEHREIHATLVEATQVSGRIGTAAKALARVLHPHFVREEQIALPPLGLLSRLAAGEAVPASEASEILAMSDSLRRELPRMLEEHERIRAAVEGLRQAAVSRRAPKYQRLAEQLAMHAQSEEEVLYPAAILVGDILRARQGD